MDDILLSNIKKSIKIVTEENPQVPDSLIEIIEKEPIDPIFPPIGEIFTKSALQPVPWFYRNSCRELKSPQQSFFGLYSIRNILRGILMGLRFIQSGDSLKLNNFFALSIFSYYTSAFHLLQSFLALNGLVIVEIVKGPPKIIKRKKSSEVVCGNLDPNPELIIGKLKKDNSWKFESRNRSHASRWKELEQVFSKRGYKVPDFFISFFQYILSYGGELLVDDEVLIQEGIKKLTEIRHESIYCGYGYDNYVYDGIVNGDLESGMGIDAKVNAYRDFAISLITYCVNDLLTIIGNVSEHWNKVYKFILCSTYIPPFEVGDPSLPEAELTEKLKLIYSWTNIPYISNT